MKRLLITFLLVKGVFADIFITQDSSSSDIPDYQDGGHYQKYDLVRLPMMVQGKKIMTLWKFHGSKNKTGKPGLKDSPWKFIAVLGEKSNFSINVKKENIYEYKDGFSYSNGHILSYKNKLWRLKCDTTLKPEQPETVCQWQFLGTFSKGSDVTQKDVAQKKTNKKTKAK